MNRMLLRVVVVLRLAVVVVMAAKSAAAVLLSTLDCGVSVVVFVQRSTSTVGP